MKGRPAMDIRARLRPLPPHASFRLQDWITWCASVCRTADGRCHLYASRWPRALGHNAWVTHSEVVYATADQPLGPYTLQGTILGRRDTPAWDRDVAHNPTIMPWQGRYYLYYTGNYGNGEFWDHRNHQRIGVAVADDPAGPWQRSDAPLLEPNPDGWDALITTNPSCTPTPDGRFLLMYKSAGRRAPLPMGGPVLHGVAFSDSPTGPFRKHPEPLFAAGEANFPAEDPFVWMQDGKLYAILKDQGHFYSPEERALVLFESDNGIDWRPNQPAVVCTRQVVHADGTAVTYHRLERPQLLLEGGVPSMLCAAVKPTRESDDSYSIFIPLQDH